MKKFQISTVVVLILIVTGFLTVVDMGAGMTWAQTIDVGGATGVNQAVGVNQRGIFNTNQTPTIDSNQGLRIVSVTDYTANPVFKSLRYAPVELWVNKEIKSATLYYSYDGNSFYSFPMNRVQHGFYKGVFPIPQALEKVAYYVSVESLDGNRLLYPAGAPRTTLSFKHALAVVPRNAQTTKVNIFNIHPSPATGQTPSDNSAGATYIRNYYQHGYGAKQGRMKIDFYLSNYEYEVLSKMMRSTKQNIDGTALATIAQMYLDTLSTPSIVQTRKLPKLRSTLSASGLGYVLHSAWMLPEEREIFRQASNQTDSTYIGKAIMSMVWKLNGGSQ